MKTSAGFFYSWREREKSKKLPFAEKGGKLKVYQQRFF